MKNEDTPKQNIVDFAHKLAQLMKSEPSGVEKPLLKRGEELVGVWSDPTYNLRRFPDLHKRKIEVLEKAIEDVSVGVMTLRSSSIGLLQKAGKLSPYITPHGSPPNGDVVFSINWKNIVAFKNWRREDGTDDISQDDINAAIYKLTASMAEFLD